MQSFLVGRLVLNNENSNAANRHGAAIFDHRDRACGLIRPIMTTMKLRQSVNQAVEYMVVVKQDIFRNTKP